MLLDYNEKTTAELQILAGVISLKAKQINHCSAECSE